MTTEITEPAVELNIDDIKRIEKEIGLEFPEDYSNFLIRNNGGKPKPDTVSYNGEYFDYVAFFYSEQFRSYSSDLIRSVANYKGLIPEHYLPIGESPSGNIYCLSLKDSDYGSVYFWDHDEANYEGDPWEENMYKLSNSLAEFIDSLYEEKNA